MNPENKTRCSAKLRNAAILAAKAANRARIAHSKWVEMFGAEYGHEDISDSLVEVIDYSTGNTDFLTREFIHENSQEGDS